MSAVRVASRTLRTTFFQASQKQCSVWLGHHHATSEGPRRYNDCRNRQGDFGVGRDRVIVYMPMIPEALVGMLACARIGAIHSVVFGGFAAKELATRIEDAEPKLVLTASCGIEPGRIVEYKPLLDLAIGISKHKPEAVVLFQRPQTRGQLGRRPRPRLGEAGRRGQRRGQARRLR